ncbi:hypothetical protein K438DRAFT_1778168 [Mycena galopus ATCC 62051]|nr:hypothetical protein K438DRAFT_1778168 [Mycena galopus ATCC 62051]
MTFKIPKFEEYRGVHPILMFDPALTIISFFCCVSLDDDFIGVEHWFSKSNLQTRCFSEGMAGNVVASRLLENPSVSILVLEAGPSNDGVLDAQVPFLANGVSDSGTPYS